MNISDRISKTILRQVKMKTNPTKLMGCSKFSFKRKVQSYTSLPQGTEKKIQNKQSKFNLKKARKRRNKTQSGKREENNGDQRANKQNNKQKNNR